MVTVVLKGTSFRASIMMYYSINWRAHCAGISTANVAICVGFGTRDVPAAGNAMICMSLEP